MIDQYAASLEAFIRAVGFNVRSSEGGEAYFTHPLTAACTYCGWHPDIVPDAYAPGKWLALCPHCSARTISTKNPLQAVRNWNAGRFTADTTITHHKLTVENLDDDGAVNLLEALKEDAVRDLMRAERLGDLDEDYARNAAWFINNDQVVKDIVSGDRRRREEEEKKRREEEERRKAHAVCAEGSDSGSPEPALH